MEEFTQMFCVESAFRQATMHFETMFRQKVSVDTLEAIARGMNAEAEEYAEALPCPASVDGELALGQFGGVAGRAAWLEVAGW
jgi:hypothetical protein